MIYTKLSNDIRVVTEEMPGAKSVAIGLWTNVGSRDERKDFSGCSHFLEHLLFKGTEKRTSKEISTIIEAKGGYLNAFTDRDMTCFHARVLEKDTELAIDVLSDVVQNPLLRQEDIKKELQVVRSEISRRDDDPEDLVHDLCVEKAWRGNDAAHSVLGDHDRLVKLGQDDVRKYYEEHYIPAGMTLIAAGDINHDKLIDLAEKYLNFKRPGGLQRRIKPSFNSGINVIERKSSQAQIAISSEGSAHGDDRRAPLTLLHSYLGLGASSKLFQEVREKQGLVYSIYTHNYSMSDAGLFTIYAGAKEENVVKVVQTTLNELEALRNGGASMNLDEVKQKTIGFTILRSESPESRMIQLGVTTIRTGKPKTINQVIEEIEGVSLATINKISKNIFDREKLSITTLGLSREFIPKVEALLG
jgi:predicted Zn-dependent peptidase